MIHAVEEEMYFYIKKGRALFVLLESITTMAALTVTYKVLSTQAQPIYLHFTSHIKRIYLNSMVHSSVFFLHIDVEN